MLEGLLKNKKALGLVALIKPVELMKVVIKHSDLIPKDAAKLIFDLRKKAEALSSPAIETNKQFPVPPSLKKDDDDQEEIEEAGGKIDVTPKHDFMRYHFPPDPIKKSNVWPFDDMTIAAMKPGNKGKKRPLMNAKVPIKKNPLAMKIGINQPGGDGSGGAGIYSRRTHSFDNSTSTAGNSTWNTRGTPGWSSAPPGKEFDLPNEIEPNEEGAGFSAPNARARVMPNAGDSDDEPKFLKQPNAGGTVWNVLSQPGRALPYRGYKKR